MNILVTYGSKYGHTEQYARWIAEALGCACKPARTVGREELKRYDVIVHGGGLYAGGLRGISVLTCFRRKTLSFFPAVWRTLTTRKMLPISRRA